MIGNATLDHRAVAAVGRTARQELVFSRRRGRTILSHAYAEPPFRTGQPFASNNTGVEMILAWSAPGVFGGDCLEQRIHIERGSSVRLASQSALQAHPDPAGGCATLHTAIDVEEGAELRCEWDPLIPFPAARFSQKIAINLAAGAALYWSDAFMAGREGRGERWAFGTLGHEFAVWRGDSLVYLERFCLEPAVQMPESRWVASDCCYFGTVLAVGPSPGADNLQNDLSSFKGVRGAVDALDADMTLVRLMAQRGPAFHDARTLVRRGLCA